MHAIRRLAMRLLFESGRDPRESLISSTKRVLIPFSALLVAAAFVRGCTESPTQTVTNPTYIINGDSLSDPNVSPRIIFTNPASGAFGPFGNVDPTRPTNPPEITIQFNKLINVLDLSSTGVTLKSTDGYHLLTLADLAYYGGGYGYMEPILRNILIFRSSGKYLAGYVYTVTVDTTVVDVHGKKLSAPYVFNFTPEPTFRVWSVYPTGVDIPPESSVYIVISFNSRITSAVFSSLSIAPPLKGTWTLNPYTYGSDSTAATFIPKDTMSYDAQYTVSVAAGASDANGLHMSAPYQYSFVTAPFEAQLGGYASYTGPGGFQISNNFSVSFNADIDTSTVRSSVSISPPLGFSLTFQASSSSIRGLVITLNELQMQRATTYQILLMTTIRSLKGDHLKTPFTFYFTTGS